MKTFPRRFEYHRDQVIFSKALGVPLGQAKEYSKKAEMFRQRSKKNNAKKKTKEEDKNLRAPWLRDLFISAGVSEDKATRASDNIARNTIFYKELRDDLWLGSRVSLDRNVILRGMAYTFADYIYDASNLRRIDNAFDAARYGREQLTESLLIDEFRFGTMRQTEDIQVNGVLIENAGQAKKIQKALNKMNPKERKLFKTLAQKDPNLGKKFLEHVAHEMEAGDKWKKIARNKGKVADIQQGKEKRQQAKTKPIVMGKIAA